ncbi:MAG: hypothetical protein KJ792_15690 [Actinobacteria bacterium]|nr:hypothetical protein [Actinomycetota bacterium]MCG2802363.1 hypothetical protein [Cellulomonas sp.]
MIHRRLARLRDDSGTSLVELLVTMIVAAVVLAATVAMSSGLQRTAAQVVVRQDQTDVGRQAADRISAMLRSAAAPSQLSKSCTTGCGAVPAAFLSASGTSMSFISNFGNPDGTNGPIKVSYSVPATGASAGHIVETVQKASLSGTFNYSFCDTASATCRSTTVTTRDLTPASTVATAPAVFGYVDSTGNQLQAGGGSLTATELPGVMVVDLRLSVQGAAATRAKPTTFIGRVDLPNQQTVLSPR